MDIENPIADCIFSTLFFSCFCQKETRIATSLDTGRIVQPVPWLQGFVFSLQPTAPLSGVRAHFLPRVHQRPGKYSTNHAADNDPARAAVKGLHAMGRFLGAPRPGRGGGVARRPWVVLRGRAGRPGSAACLRRVQRRGGVHHLRRRPDRSHADPERLGRSYSKWRALACVCKTWRTAMTVLIDNFVAIGVPRTGKPRPSKSACCGPMRRCSRGTT